jgi:predicted permease
VLLLGLSRAARVHVDPAFLLVAGMPVAFHVLVISRITGLRHELAARAVIASTAIAVPAVVTWVALR